MSTLAELATLAADLIEAAPESAWTQGALARRISGESVPIDWPAAVCWCAVGHLYRNGAHAGWASGFIVVANDNATDRADAIARLRALAAPVSA